MRGGTGPQASANDGSGVAGECEARLVFGLCLFAGFVWACFFRPSGRFGQVFQRGVEAFFGIICTGLFSRFPKLLDLGLFRHG